MVRPHAVVAFVAFVAASSASALIPFSPPAFGSSAAAAARPGFVVTARYCCVGGSASTTSRLFAVGASPEPATKSADTSAEAESESAPVSAASSSSSSYFATLLRRFRGDFDNYHQVLRDRADGYTEAREGGGHEHIHCTMIPVDVNVVRDHLGDGGGAAAVGCVGEDEEQLGRDGEEGVGEDANGREGGGAAGVAEWSAARLAAFYFDASPQRIFRLRLYVLRPDPRGAYLRLFTLGPSAEGAIRAISEHPEQWVDTLQAVLSKGGAGTEFDELHGCDVIWTESPNPDRHSYAYGINGNPPPHLEYLPDLDPRSAQHAVMLQGECTIPSLMSPGSMIRVVDELSLWDDHLWINDRGFCPDTGDFIYGNHRGVPYEMNLCADWDDDGRSRKLVKGEAGEELGWTLGRSWRGEGIWEDKMDAIGGPTAKMSGGPPGRKKLSSA